MIKNAKDSKLNQVTGGMPDVSAALMGWFSAISFSKVQKQTNASGYLKENPIKIETQGVIQPLSAQEVAIKPEGQRTWKWLMIHCLPDVKLEPDDIIEVDCQRYRVMGIFNFTRNGYVRYDCGQDFQGGNCP